MHPWYHYVIIIAISTFVGCAQHPLVNMEPSHQQTYTHGLNNPIPNTKPVVAEPDGTIALGDAIALALANSPRLRAFDADVRAAEAYETQAGRWSNPDFELEVENMAGSGDLSGVDAAEVTLSVAQTFPIGGDIQRRRELAAAHTRLADWDYEAARLELIVEVTQRFVEALTTERRLDLARRELVLAQDIARGATVRIEAGDASPVEAARTAVPVIIAEVAVQRAERLRETAYHRLVLTWGSERASFDGLAGSLDDIQPVPDAATLVQHINQNPVVARWTAGVGTRIAERRLAEAEATSNLTGRIGTKYHNETNDAAFVIGISLPLPVFDRRQDDILAARFAETAARHRQRKAELQIESILNTAFTQLVNAQAQAIALRDRALPTAQRAFDATQRAFNEGQLTFLDVLDTQRTLIDLERRYIDALKEYHTASAEIESLIGQRLADISEPTPIPGESL